MIEETAMRLIERHEEMPQRLDERDFIGIKELASDIEVA